MKEKREMLRSTIYFEKALKIELLSEAHTLSLKTGKKYAMTDIIKDALIEYFNKRGKKLEHSIRSKNEQL